MPSGLTGRGSVKIRVDGTLTLPALRAMEKAVPLDEGSEFRLPKPHGLYLDLLRYLAGNPGRVYTRGQLLELVRDYDALEQDERTINVHISHIREKIEPDPAQPRYIVTLRGVGYAFAEE